MRIKTAAKITIGVALVVGFVLLAYEVFFWFTHVYENNARVQTELTNMSAQIDGKIDNILVKEGERVKKGQLLIVLVDDDVRMNIEALHTDLALETANRARLLSEKSAFESELASKLETHLEKIRASELELQSARARLQLAEKNLTRAQYLFDKNLTSEAKLNDEQDKALSLRGDVAQLNASVAVAKKERAQLQATAKQIDVIAERVKISDVEQTRIKDSIKKQEISLSYRYITSPIDGVIGRIHKFKGEYVEDGVNILMLHDPDVYWLEAYVDESEIRHIRVGQKVRINLEAYPFDDFFGNVRQIGSITTTQMGIDGKTISNSSFGGTIEHVPVRISMDDPPPNLTPGMRATINVRIYEQIKLW